MSSITLISHSTGGGEVARYIGRHGTKRVAKTVLICSPSLKPDGGSCIEETADACNRRYADIGIRPVATTTFLNRVPRATLYVRYRTDCGQFCNYYVIKF